MAVTGVCGDSLAPARSRDVPGAQPPASAAQRAASRGWPAAANPAAAARKVGVLAVAPLGLCFLPAFVCLGIVPVVVGLASQVLVP